MDQPNLYDAVETKRMSSTLDTADSKHLARTTDPQTSKDAAAQAVARCCDQKSGEKVMTIFEKYQGVCMLDEFLVAHCKTIFGMTPSRVRAGRKWLADNNRIKLTGRKRRTTSGGMSREWIKS